MLDIDPRISVKELANSCSMEKSTLYDFLKEKMGLIKKMG
jgi:predicted DNA-binding transcriptional regulator AlpA